MTGLISIGIQRRLFLLIWFNQGETKSSFLCLLMLTLQRTSPPGAAIQGYWYLSIRLPSIGISRGRQLLKQVLLEQSSVPWRQMCRWLSTYVAIYGCLEYQYMAILTCYVITRLSKRIQSHQSLYYRISIIILPTMGAGRQWILIPSGLLSR